MENNHTNEKTNHICLEYFLGIILAFGLWAYHLINAAIISQNLAIECIYF